MSLFKDMLKDNQSLFKNEIALDFNFIPKIVPYRESQQRFIASCMKPLFNNQNGQNVLIHGIPGVGKTVALKHILKELEEETDDIVPIFINCWQKNTIHKVAVEMCHQLDMNLLTNQRTEEIFRRLIKYFNKKSLVLVLDEIDKFEDFDFIYTILEDVYRKSIILITNYKEWIITLDERIKSRLVPEMIEFPAYNEQETHGILQQRIDYAFVPGVWDEDTLRLISKKTFEVRDVRTGLDLIRKSARIAESKASKKVLPEHVKEAIGNYAGTVVNDSEALEDELKFILGIIKKNSGQKIGDLFKIYSTNGGKGTYKTFQRKVKKLSDGKFISVKKIVGGTAGSTTLVKYVGENKTLDKF